MPHTNHITYTRRQLLAGECNHRQFYGQLVTPFTKERVLTVFPLSVLQREVETGFMDMGLDKWDSIGVPADAVILLRETGDSYSLSGAVCINKEAALQIVEQSEAKS